MTNKIYLKLIFETNHKHPAIDVPILACVYNYDSEIISYYNFSHPDVDIDCKFDDFKLKYKNYDIYVIDKKRYLYYLEGFNILDINSIVFSNNGDLIKIEDNNVLNVQCEIDMYNYIVPFSIHQSNFESDIFKIKNFNNESYDKYSFNFFNNFLSETLYNVEREGIKVDKKIFDEFFKAKLHNEFVYTQYNIHNPTGRPSNHFDNINYVALNKENGCRKSFISRYEDGYYLMVDFIGFHPYIVSKLIGHEIPENETIYEYLAKQYYNKDVIEDEDISKSKKLTMINLYGDIKDCYLDIEFFKKTEDLKKSYWDCFLKNGYVETPLYKRKINTSHIKNPNKNKLFSYIIQSAETEYSINSLDKCLKFIGDKDISPLLYVYDSVVFDVSKKVKKEDIIQLVDIFKNNSFKIRCYAGKNYDELVCIFN